MTYWAACAAKKSWYYQLEKLCLGMHWPVFVNLYRMYTVHASLDQLQMQTCGQVGGVTVRQLDMTMNISEC